MFVFFNNKGLLYAKYMPRGTLVNPNYIVEALCKFMKVFKSKMPVMSKQERFFYWNNSSVDAAAVLQDWIAARALLIIQHPFYLPDLALEAFFLSQMVKKELTGLTRMPTTFKKSW